VSTVVSGSFPFVAQHRRL